MKHYRIETLKELAEMIEDMMAHVRVDAGRKVSMDEVYMSSGVHAATFTLNRQTLTDGSVVYDISLGA